MKIFSPLSAEAMCLVGLLRVLLISTTAGDEDEELINDMFSRGKAGGGSLAGIEVDSKNPLKEVNPIYRHVAWQQNYQDHICNTTEACTEQYNICVRAFGSNVFQSRCLDVILLRLDQLDYVNSGRAIKDKLTSLIPISASTTKEDWNRFFTGPLFADDLLVTPFDNKLKGFDKELFEHMSRTPYVKAFFPSGIKCKDPSGMGCILDWHEKLRTVGHDAPLSGYLLWLNLGNHWRGSKRPWESFQCYRKALGLHKLLKPDHLAYSDFSAHENMGILLAECGRVNLGIRLLEAIDVEDAVPYTLQMGGHDDMRDSMAMTRKAQQLVQVGPTDEELKAAGVTSSLNAGEFIKTKHGFVPETNPDAVREATKKDKTRLWAGTPAVNKWCQMLFQTLNDKHIETYRKEGKSDADMERIYVKCYTETPMFAAFGGKVKEEHVRMGIRHKLGLPISGYADESFGTYLTEMLTFLFGLLFFALMTRLIYPWDMKLFGWGNSRKKRPRKPKRN